MEQTLVGKHYSFSMRSVNYVEIFLCLDHVTLILHTTKMAEVWNTNCYVFRNNSDGIFEALQEEDESDQDFSVTDNKASIS